MVKVEVRQNDDLDVLGLHAMTFEPGQEILLGRPRSDEVNPISMLHVRHLVDVPKARVNEDQPVRAFQQPNRNRHHDAFRDRPIAALNIVPIAERQDLLTSVLRGGPGVEKADCERALQFAGDDAMDLGRHWHLSSRRRASPPQAT
jgi:hypothetical protein